MKSIKSIVTAIAVTAGMAFTSLSCFAEETPAGNVTVAVEKFSLGQGYVVEPIVVPFYEGDNGTAIMKRAAEIKETSYEYDGVQYSYISAFLDTTSTMELAFPEVIKTALETDGIEIGARSTENWLGEYDYSSGGGYVYFVNDVYPSYGIADYAPTDGDVIRFAFTVYGYGADNGVDNSAWGGAASLIPNVSRSPLTELVANTTDNLEAREIGIKALSDLASTQEDLDNAYAEMEALLAPVAESIDATVETSVDTQTDEETAEEVSENVTVTDEKANPTTGVEGVAIAVVIAVSGIAGLVISKKRR